MTALIVDRIKNGEYARQVHRVTPEAGTSLEEVLEPSYWANVAAKFTQGDKVEILPEDGAYYAEALVVVCSRIHAKLQLLLHKQFHEQEKPAAKENKPKDPFEIAFKGPQRRWSVIRTSDLTYVKEGFGDKEAAQKWLEDNLKDLEA